MKRILGEWRYFDETLNMPYPWYTKGCLEFLETINFNGKRIFEYGVGDSTLWFRSRGAQTFGVDSSIEWVSKIGCKFAVFNNDYVNAIEDTYSPYDIVSIDGLWRDDCVEKALSYVKPGGLVIVDNFLQPSVSPNNWKKTLDIYSNGSWKKWELFHELSHEDWKTLVVTV